MIDEIWKTIVNYSDYQVSNFGRVKSLDRYSTFRSLFSRFHRGRILKQFLTKNGYLFVGLSKEGIIKQFLVSRLVALMFISNSDTDKKEVNHKDGNKINNFVDNLEWVTPSENCRHTYRILKKIHPRGTKGRRVNCCPVLQYTVEGSLVKRWTALTDICKELGFSSSSVTRACNTGEIVCGFIWKREKCKKDCASVRQTDLSGNFIKDWSSVDRVSVELDLSAKLIRDCCNRVIESAYGYLWNFMPIKAELRYVKKERKSYKGISHNNPFANGEKNYFAKLTTEKVRKLKELYDTGNLSRDQLSKKFGISKKYMMRIIHEKAWKHLKNNYANPT